MNSMTHQPNLNIYFPVEGIMRELDFRLVLAVKMVERRHRIFIGQPFHLFRLMSQSEGGVYVGKSISATWPRDVFRPHDPYVGRVAADVAESLGVPVVHLSEEGSVFFGNEAAWGPQLDIQAPPSVFLQNTRVLTWGDLQRDYYRRRHAHLAGQIVTTGHPRFDLYREEYRALFRDDAADLSREFGRFVLVNTNFTLANHPQGQSHVFSKHENYFVEDDDLRRSYVRAWSRVNRCMPAFVELVHELSLRRKDVNIVVRPHPSEDDAVYRAAFAGASNVHVLRRGSVSPWLLAASVVIHDGCTTGLEAYLLDRPVVNYRPVPDEEDTQLYLPNVFGETVSTRDVAVDVILDMLERGDMRPSPPRDEIPALAQSLFHGFHNESFPLVLEQIRRAEAQATGAGRGPGRARIATDEMIAFTLERLKRTVRPLFRERYLSAKHARAAFYGLDRSMVAARLANIERLVGKRVELGYHGPNLIEIRAA